MAVRLAPNPTRELSLTRSNVSAWTVLVGALLTVGIAAWSLSLSSIPLDRMDDLGIGPVLPPGIWVGIALVTVGFAVAWWRGSEPQMALGVLATILVLHGIGVLGEPTMRFATAWQHVGIADYIATHGAVDPNIDAYFNWPGFFALSGFVSSAMGLENIEPVARFAPLFLNVMYLMPLVVIGRALFDDRRLVWLGIWLFYAYNWIGQDYFSPQGLAFFLYLVVLAVVLRWFKGFSHSGPNGRARRWGRLTRQLKVVPDTPSTAGQRVLLVGVIAVLVAAIVASHQLTPFALVTATVALALVGWDRLRTLPVAVLLMTLLWAAYMAITYLTGHIHELASDVGAVNSTVSTSVGGRIKGSDGHQTIVQVRLVTMATLWAVALLSFLRSARRGELAPGLLALAVAPFPLLALQSYGGEVVLRIALFSMPFMAFAGAALFVPGARGAGRNRPGSPFAMAALACFVAVLLVAWPFNRYGNERMDYYPRPEITAMQQLYRIAPAGSALFAASWALPWRYEHYADYYYYSSLSEGSPELNFDQRDPDKLARAVADRMRAADVDHAYVVITSSTIAQNDLFGPWKPGAQARMRDILAASPLFRVVYRNPDATILQLR